MKIICSHQKWNTAWEIASREEALDIGLETGDSKKIFQVFQEQPQAPPD